MTLGYPRSDAVLRFKGQGHRVSKFILHTRTLRTRIAIHRHSLGGVISRLRFCGCLLCATLTFARWRNQSSAWVRNQDRVLSSLKWQQKLWRRCLKNINSGNGNFEWNASEWNQRQARFLFKRNCLRCVRQSHAYSFPKLAHGSLTHFVWTLQNLAWMLYGIIIIMDG